MRPRLSPLPALLAASLLTSPPARAQAPAAPPAATPAPPTAPAPSPTPVAPAPPAQPAPAQPAAPAPVAPGWMVPGQAAPVWWAPQPAPAPAPPAPPAPAPPGRPRVGPMLTLAGPSSMWGIGVMFTASRLLEPALWLGRYTNEEEQKSSLTTVSARLALTTVMARSRVWFFEHHSLVGDVGAGISRYRLEASGSSIDGDSIVYERSGYPIVASAGVGYGFRADNGFRFSVVLGAIVHLSKIGSSMIQTSESFSAQERRESQLELDQASDKLTKPRPYLDLSFGWVF